MKALFFLIYTFLFMTNAMGQGEGDREWNGKRCAVVLTYDDGLNVHLDKVVPALDAKGFKATFYIPGNSGCLYNRMEQWRAAACNGHELGNHTLFHPCIGRSLGRSWVSPDQDLDNYTVGRMVSEIGVASTLLKGVDGRDRRSFAYTCGDKTVRDTSFVPFVKDHFVGARGVVPRMETLGHIDLFDVGAYGANGQSGKELIEWVKAARQDGRLLVFLFHGVGGEHALNVSQGAHAELLEYLKANEDDIWVAPFAEVVVYAAQRQ
ncbi:MAG: polysaccharide deacetylase family protein [Breznakibacter sp.]